MHITKWFSTFLSVIQPPELYMTRIVWYVCVNNADYTVRYNFDSLNSLHHQIMVDSDVIFDDNKWIGKTIPFTVKFNIDGIACVCAVYQGQLEIEADLYVGSDLMPKAIW